VTDRARPVGTDQPSLHAGDVAVVARLLDEEAELAGT
jgi:hypothetical protein